MKDLNLVRTIVNLVQPHSIENWKEQMKRINSSKKRTKPSKLIEIEKSMK